MAIVSIAIKARDEDTPMVSVVAKYFAEMPSREMVSMVQRNSYKLRHVWQVAHRSTREEKGEGKEAKQGKIQGGFRLRADQTVVGVCLVGLVLSKIK